MASRGLSSWLSSSMVDASNVRDASTVMLSESPSDMMRTKEIITLISPDKRSLVEAIDSEEDDAEFDERAHWSRRGLKKKVRVSRKSTEDTDKSQPSIVHFCVKETTGTGQKADMEGDTMMSITAHSGIEETAKKDESRERKAITRDSCGLEANSVVDSVKEKDPRAMMISGRPKRRAVIHAEILQQQQRLLDAVAARKQDTSFLTPPPLSKKMARDGNSTMSGRKRKLEVNNKMATLMKGGSTTSSPKVTQTFFLSEQEKKLLQEIEAVSLLREQLRQTREKDLAFFAGKTANPFFQARAANTKLESQVDERVMVVSGDDDEGGEGMQRRGSRWSKFFPLHPTVQHVFSVCPETECMDTTVAQTKPPLFAPKRMSFTAEKVYDDSETLKTLPNEVIAVLQASLNGQVTTESSFSETFWFREYLDASSFPAPDMKLVDLTLSRSKEDIDAASADFAERETSLVDELVETHGMQENQVRELLVGMEQARAKRGGRERNLTLADRYLPVNARGLVGNREPLHTLFSWLNAWKVGGGDREKLNCFESELITFEDGDCGSGDEVGDLCRLFILEGESGSGKSAAVYACAEELGYEIIEINAAQNRSGKSIIELAGEATQSTCVLHVGAQKIKSKKKHKKKRRRHSENRRSLDHATAASLSLVMFEDIDVVFEEDKGFYNAVCSIAKHSKCPIVITCAQLPDTFPAKPGRLCRELRKPSMDEFATWMRLVAFIEGLKVAPSLINVLGTFFDRDVRRSLHFLEAHLPNSESSTKTNWRWQHAHSEENEVSHVDIPAWTTWSTGSTSFDPLTSNLLVELSAVAESMEKPFEDKGREEKQAEVNGLIELAQIMESASVADVWMVNASASGEDGTEDSFFLCERRHLAALELRRSSLCMLGLSASSLGASLMQGQGPVASRCVQRTLDNALASTSREVHRTMVADLKAKFELPLAYIGCGKTEPRFTLDYMPMVGRLLSSTGVQEGRRRASRRNHYLRDVLGDMSLLDDLPSFNTYKQPDIVASRTSTL